jgi:hypothetical protein
VLGGLRPDSSRGDSFARPESSEGSSARGCDRSAPLTLALILTLALGLRLGGVRYGLPYFAHPDESILVPLAVQVLTGDLNPHFFNWPTLYMYVLSGVYAVYGVVLQATDGLSAAAAFVRDPARFYLIGRVITAVLGTATVGLTYLLGARLSGRAVGLAASFFLAVSLQHVVDSHFATTDVPVTGAIVLALLATLSYWERGGTREAGAAGLLGGLAASAKYNGGLVGAAFVAAHLVRWRAGRDRHDTALVGPALAAWLLGAGVGFLAGTPFAALAPREFARGVIGEVRAIGAAQFGNEAAPPALLFHLLHALPQAVGTPLLLAAGVGLAVWLRRPRPEHAVVLAFPLPYLAIIGTWGSRFERYAVPLLPFVCLLAAVGLAALTRRRGRRVVPILAAAAVLIASPVLARVLYYEMLLRRPDSREVAGQWIESNIPAGSSVAMERYSPPTPWGDHTLGSRPMLSPPQGLAERLPRMASAARPPARLRILPLDAYDVGVLRHRGIDYVVLSSFVYQRHMESCDRFPQPCRFYADLARRARLVYALHPSPEGQRLWVGDIYAPVSQVFGRTRPGPSVKIYKLVAQDGVSEASSETPVVAGPERRS